MIHFVVDSIGSLYKGSSDPGMIGTIKQMEIGIEVRLRPYRDVTTILLGNEIEVSAQKFGQNAQICKLADSVSEFTANKIFQKFENLDNKGSFLMSVEVTIIKERDNPRICLRDDKVIDIKHFRDVLSWKISTN